MGIDLPLLWAVIILVAVMLYVMMDGYDLGIGLLFPFVADTPIAPPSTMPCLICHPRPAGATVFIMMSHRRCQRRTGTRQPDPEVIPVHHDV